MTAKQRARDEAVAAQAEQEAPHEDDEEEEAVAPLATTEDTQTVLAAQDDMFWLESMDRKAILDHLVSTYSLQPVHQVILKKEIDEVFDGFGDEDEKREDLQMIAHNLFNMKWFLISSLGEGGFGSVYKAYLRLKDEASGIMKSTQHVIAVKVINLEDTEDDIATITREINGLSQGRFCKQLTDYHGSAVFGTNLWIGMEYLDGGSVQDMLKYGILKEKHIATIAREVLQGLSYLRDVGLIHRDIKAANILLSTQGAVKLADFGGSRKLTDTTKMTTTTIGSPHWMAPEVIKMEPYDGKADMWSLGITCVEMATGRPPRSNLAPTKIMRVIASEPPVLQDIKNRPPFSPAFKEFVSRCCRINPDERPEVAELLQDPFLKKAVHIRKLKELFKMKDKLEALPQRSTPAPLPRSSSISAAGDVARKRGASLLQKLGKR